MGLRRAYFRVINWLRRHISVTFLLLVALSTLLWFLTKLSYTYVAEVPVRVFVGDTRLVVKSMAEGSGYRIFMLRNMPGDALRVTLEQVNATPSPTSKDSYIVDPLSLQNAISQHLTGLKIISIEPLPEITPKE